METLLDFLSIIGASVFMLILAPIVYPLYNAYVKWICKMFNTDLPW